MRPLTCVAAAVLAIPASAQCTGFFPQSIQAANAFFVQNDLPDSRTSPLGGASFSADLPNQSDVLFALWHYYRVDGMTREIPFKDVRTQCLGTSYGPDTMTLLWPDVDNRGQFSARLVVRVSSTGSDAGCVSSAMTITNTSASPLTFDLFTYADIDLCGAGGNLAAAVSGDGRQQRVDDPSCPASNVVFRGTLADRWEVASYPTIQVRLLDDNLDDLANSGLPFGPGDFSGALQWADRVIAPGQSLTFESTLCHNEGRCPNGAATSNYGAALAGSRGVATLTTATLPILGRSGELAIANAQPFTTGVLTIGLGRASVPVGNVTLLTVPIAVEPLQLDALGAGRRTFAPPADPNLCGAQVHFQYLFVDPGVTGLLPIAHTDGVEWTLGS